jgi:hypothetical protein
VCRVQPSRALGPSDEPSDPQLSRTEHSSVGDDDLLRLLEQDLAARGDHDVPHVVGIVDEETHVHVDERESHTCRGRTVARQKQPEVSIPSVSESIGESEILVTRADARTRGDEQSLIVCEECESG